VKLPTCKVTLGALPSRVPFALGSVAFLYTSGGWSAKYGSEHMWAIGKSGYFATGAKYGWDFVNHLLFGVHLSTGTAQKILLSNSDKTQLRMYLPDPCAVQMKQTLKTRKQANKFKGKSM
jgi:hypothetical protein